MNKENHFINYSPNTFDINEKIKYNGPYRQLETVENINEVIDLTFKKLTETILIDSSFDTEIEIHT